MDIEDGQSAGPYAEGDGFLTSVMMRSDDDVGESIAVAQPSQKSSSNDSEATIASTGETTARYLNHLRHNNPSPSAARNNVNRLESRILQSANVPAMSAYHSIGKGKGKVRAQA